MNLTTKARYAVMAMVDLAVHSNGKPISLADIADRQQIALSYLEQIFMKLRKGNLVRSVRGPGGGYVLAHKTENILISYIINAVDEPMKMTRCSASKGTGCMHKNSKCLTHNLWDGLSNQINNYFSSISIADIYNENIDYISNENVKSYA